MTDYHMHGVTLTKSQANKIYIAAKNHTPVVIRIKKENLQGGAHKLPLTETQIKRVNNAKKGMDFKLSAAQLSHLEKTGGLIPLLALLPLIFGGLGAAGGVAGGVASAVSAANNAKAAAAAQAETERHNREVEAQLKSGAGARGAGGPTGGGVVSNFVGKTPVVGSLLKTLLQKIGLGNNSCNKVLNGGCVKCGKGLYIKPYGAGLFIGPPPR